MRRRKRPYGKIVMLCVGTLILTYVMGRYFESLYLKFADVDGNDLEITETKDEKGLEVEENIQIVQNGFNIYLIQNGVFTIEGGAESHADVLEMEGFKPCIFYDESYRIVTGIYMDKDLASAELEKQRQLGFDNFLLEVEIPDLALSVATEDDKGDIEDIWSKFNKVFLGVESYYDDKGLTEAVDVTRINYDGNDQEILEIIDIIKGYGNWSATKNDEVGEEFLASLSIYLRQVQ